MRTPKDGVRKKESQQPKKWRASTKKSLIQLTQNPDGSSQYASGKTPEARAEQWKKTTELMVDTMRAAHKSKDHNMVDRLFKAHPNALRARQIAFDESLKAPSKSGRTRNRLWGKSLIKSR